MNRSKRRLPSIAQEAAIVSTAAQCGILGAWSIRSVWPLVITLGMGLIALIAHDQSCAQERKERSFLQKATHSAMGQQLALGGLGMLLGAWADAQFQVPPCMCCLWGPNTPALLMVMKSLGSWSSIGMGVGCLIAMGASDRRIPGLTKSLRCGLDLIGMQLGMWAIMQPVSEVMRMLPKGKLFFGHITMVLGMALGSVIMRKIAKRLSPRRSPSLF